jgi:hypothetical protein
MQGSNPGGLRRHRIARPKALAALAVAGAGLALAPAAMAAPSASLEVTHPGHQNIQEASTYTAGTIHLANSSTAGETITSFSIDLADGPTLFPDLVFDPDDGTPAGDQNGRTLIMDTAPAGVTLAAGSPTFDKPKDDGFGLVSAAFDGGFDPGESGTFSIDIDPTSINGSPGSAPAGPISGAEIQGATVSVTFSDGTTLTNELTLIAGSDSDASATLVAGVPVAPSIARAGGASAPVATSKAQQDIVVTGPAGASGVLVVVEGHLDVTNAGPVEGFDIDPFEANMAALTTEIPFTIGPDGTVVVPVTLTNSAPLIDENALPTPVPFTPAETGINHIAAYLTGAGAAGAMSGSLVMQLDPAVEIVAPTVASVSPADDAIDVARDQNVQVTFSEPMDLGTLMAEGTVTVTTGEGATLQQVQGALLTNEAGTVLTYDPVEDLAFDTEYTVTVGTNATDVAGNALAAPFTSTFRTAKQPVAPPPVAPTNTGAPVCVTVPERPTNTDKGTIRLEAAQLLISQRIAQAAVRRANAIEAWLNAGVVAGDLCGNAFGQADFTGMTYVGGGVTAPVGPTPRKLEVAPASGGGGGNVALSAGQLLINQRISQAAVRRVNALAARLDGGLTGGDLVDGAIGRGKLLNGLVIATATNAAPVARSQTVLGERQGEGGTVTVSVRQLQINQRISQAAVRRVNALADRLARGLSGADFKDGTLTVADLAAEARPQ